MSNDGLMILAFRSGDQLNMQLFPEQIDTTGIIVIAIVIGALLAAALLALAAYLHQRRLEKMPTIIGKPTELLDEAAAVLGLTMSDHRLLCKLGRAMKLPQPLSILLSPVLMLEAADTWERTHRFSPSRNWGITRLNRLSMVIYGHNLGQLAHSPYVVAQPEKPSKP